MVAIVSKGGSAKKRQSVSGGGGSPNVKIEDGAANNFLFRVSWDRLKIESVVDRLVAF